MVRAFPTSPAEVVADSAAFCSGLAPLFSKLFFSRIAPQNPAATPTHDRHPNVPQPRSDLASSFLVRCPTSEFHPLHAGFIANPRRDLHPSHAHGVQSIWPTHHEFFDYSVSVPNFQSQKPNNKLNPRVTTSPLADLESATGSPAAEIVSVYQR